MRRARNWRHDSFLFLSGLVWLMPVLSESMVEAAALDWFRALGYHVVGGPDQAPGPHALRKSYADVMSASAVRFAASTPTCLRTRSTTRCAS